MNTINTIMTNTIKQTSNTIVLTKNGESKTYYKIIPGVDDYTIRDLSSYIKYKGEHYA
mgnify:CR=1 FL=1|jgi:hypothetical protein